jgi:hypothetical protein
MSSPTRSTLCLDPAIRWLCRTVDGTSLVVFRIAFGLVMAWWAWDYLATGRVERLCSEPRFHFTYYGFDWVRPWPGNGMRMEFWVMLGCSIAIALGCCYRLAAVTLAVGFSHFFLLDRTLYQNHYYLILLVSWLVVCLPLHQAWSVDAWLGCISATPSLPRWMLWLVRFQVGLPYVFGGIAKFDSDWLSTLPMWHMLMREVWLSHLTGLSNETLAWFFTYGGLVFDLGIVPLLIWRRTRFLGYLLCVGFHVLNSQLFQIHIFPWFMILATTVFFEPDWIRRLIGSHRLILDQVKTPAAWNELRRPQRLIATLLTFYLAFHCVWPLRHWLQEGQTSWTERGHFFSWRMMLRGKTSGIRFYMTDPATRQTRGPDIHAFINEEQSGKFARDPEMILQLAHFLADRFRQETGREIEVRALVLTSLNGRKPQPLIDPNVDLAREPRGFYRRRWIMPLTEPLPREPWAVPLDQWERLVAIPDLKFLAVSPSRGQSP